MGPGEDSIQESDLVLQGFEALQERFVNLKIKENQKIGLEFELWLRGFRGKGGFPEMEANNTRVKKVLKKG